MFTHYSNKGGVLGSVRGKTKYKFVFQDSLLCVHLGIAAIACMEMDLGCQIKRTKRETAAKTY